MTKNNFFVTNNGNTMTCQRVLEIDGISCGGGDGSGGGGSGGGGCGGVVGGENCQ